MSWQELVKKNGGEPIVGQIYNCVIQGCVSGKKQNIELLCVDEDDNLWRTTDDHSELSNAWDVIEWKLLTPTGEKEK